MYGILFGLPALVGLTSTFCIVRKWPMAEEWLLDRASDLFCFVAVPVIKAMCEVPTEVYFVMDGNRRWARSRNLSTARGHEAGYRCLQRLLRILTRLGIKEVTAYAFSIPNFQRTEDEKTVLFQLVVEKLQEMTRKGHIIEEHDVAVRVVGDLSMVPENVAEAAEDVRKLTGHRTGCTLNIALAYASRREMAHLATTGSLWVPTPVQKPPLFIRTSGEHRFSDFLIWQSSFAHLCFQSVLWPDYRSWHLFKALVQYNKYYAVTLRAMKSCQDQNTYFKASV